MTTIEKKLKASIPYMQDQSEKSINELRKVMTENKASRLARKLEERHERLIKLMLKQCYLLENNRISYNTFIERFNIVNTQMNFYFNAIIGINTKYGTYYNYHFGETLTILSFIKE